MEFQAAHSKGKRERAQVGRLPCMFWESNIWYLVFEKGVRHEEFHVYVHLSGIWYPTQAKGIPSKRDRYEDFRLPSIAEFSFDIWTARTQV